MQLEYSYYPGLDNLHAVKKDSSYMAHKDPRGNVIALTNADSKSVGRSYTYTSWGELHTGSDPAGLNDVDRARWKGALWFDEIGLYYMRARWYDPSLGRFISEDPIGLDGGINPYAFAAADPINGSDPTGLDWICVTDGNGLIEKCWWRFDDIEVLVPGPGTEGNWWDREADLFGPDNGGDAGAGFGGFGGRRNGFEVHWERMRLVQQRHAEQFDEFMCHAGNIGRFGGSVAADLAILYLYAQGGALAIRGAMWMAEGWAMSNGLILTAVSGSAGATGAHMMRMGRTHAPAFAWAGAVRALGSETWAALSAENAPVNPFLPVNTYNAIQGWEECR